MSIERRFIKGTQVKVRAGAKPEIEGYGSVFNEQYDSGWFIETIKPGAFARALREKQDVRCCFNHDPSNLLGRTKAGTLTLSEDTKGLKFVCDLNSDTRVGNEVHAMISRGDLDGCSFAFQVTKQTWREEKEDPNDPKSRMIQYRDIEDVDLFELGPVTFPAYEGTSVGARTARRSAMWPEGVPTEVRSHIPALAEIRITDTPDDSGDGDDDQPEECDCDCRACYSAECEECSMHMESCGDPETCCAMSAERSAKRSESRADAKTKRVDGEDLKADAFAYVGDPDKTETWKLPIKFSTDDKTKSHIQNALARFSQTQGIPAAEKPAVLAKIKDAAKKYGIHTGDESKASTISLEHAKRRTQTLLAEMSNL